MQLALFMNSCLSYMYRITSTVWLGPTSLIRSTKFAQQWKWWELKPYSHCDMWAYISLIFPMRQTDNEKHHLCFTCCPCHLQCYCTTHALLITLILLDVQNRCVKGIQDTWGRYLTYRWLKAKVEITLSICTQASSESSIHTQIF